MRDILKITPSDNVAVALRPLAPGEKVEAEGETLTVTSPVPAGHKIALCDLAPGERVIKYGFPIGSATQAILRGSHVHTHNLRTLLSGEVEYVYHPKACALPPAPAAVFQGYPRADGRVGVRNELWILPTVGCVSDVARALERRAQGLAGGAVEGVHAFTHPYGCSQMGDDQEHTRDILADLACHPNAGGVLVLGLGCENSGVETIRSRVPAACQGRIRYLVCQEAEDELEAGMALLEELAGQMRTDQRVPCLASKLTVGLKCGGSDGFSGVTANPVIGAFSDLLTAQGGSAILTEVPEMFGAEMILMERCPSRELFDKTAALINDFKRYFEAHHQTIYENPSPGNKQGGISTLEDKALGCTQKSGFSPVRDVLSYGQRLRVSGLNLLSAPGNDLVAATALAAAGAQIVLFSTGRGTPFASPVPTLKIASNSELARHKRNWIDFDAGALLQGESLSALSQALMDRVLAVAGGENVRSEENGYHDMAIFKTGVTL